MIYYVLKIAGVAITVILAYFYIGSSGKPEDMQWGVTFSKGYAESLHLDWQKTYLALLDDLKADHLRLAAYWPEVEPQDDQYDFSSLDFQVSEAKKRQAKILLALGRRLPRWPECHIPNWVREIPNDKIQMSNAELLEYMEEVVKRYRNNPNIWAWQVENEFFLRRFGECPRADSLLLDEELKLVRSLDRRPIVLTDSGELGGWFGSLKRADIFGTTMYRIVYNPMWGDFKYPLSPIYYQRRFLLYKPFVRAKQIINIELQAEPWLPLTFTADQFQENIEYARSSGISPAYLWGAEWWYYLKEKEGKDEIWDMAKKLWTK